MPFDICVDVFSYVVTEIFPDNVELFCNHRLGSTEITEHIELGPSQWGLPLISGLREFIQLFFSSACTQLQSMPLADEGTGV